MRREHTTSRREFIVGSTAGVDLLAGSAARAETDGQPLQRNRVEVEEDQYRCVLDIKVDGKPFAVYNFNPTLAGLYRPFFYPVMGPNERPITQNGEFPGTLRGHFWHRSLFVAHQKVNGISFWEERQADCGKIVHLGFKEVVSGEEGRFVEQLAWRDLAGNDLLHEIRAVGIPHSQSGSRALDITLRLVAVREDVNLMKTPYNFLACRVIDSMSLVPAKERNAKRYGSLVHFSPLNEGGRTTSSEPARMENFRGQRARWCDCSGPLGDGTWGGVALLDHPSNPRYPTFWHTWDNMIMMASFTYQEPFTLKKGQELILAYRVVVHTGDSKKADISTAWDTFSETKPIGM